METLEKMEKSAKFILIKQHTDAEITYVLQKQAKEGWWLSECKGNKLIFTKKSEITEGVCCHTVHSPSFGLIAEDVIDEQKDKWAEKGWEVFCTGALQNVQDSRRQVFLYSKAPALEVIEEPEESKKSAIRRGLSKGISNLVICLAYCVIALYGMMTGKLETLMGFIALATGLVSAVLSVLSVIYSLQLKKDYTKAVQTGHYYYIDVATIATSGTLGILAVYLLLSVV